MTNENKYPDIRANLTCGEAGELYDRESFRVRGRVFTRVEPGAYTDGKLTVFCDQQDSTSWAARVGDLRTGYFWAPEYAVEKLLKSIAAAT